MIIGITGKSGSGKSTLAEYLKTRYEDSIYLDIDTIGHEVLYMSEIKNELVSSFGECILENGNVDRKKLGYIVFNSRNEMDRLTDITWKYMQIKIDDILRKNQGKIVIMDWILLPITKYFRMCDKRILLDVPYEIRLERAIKRDNITKKDFDLREKASIDFDKDAFDLVLDQNAKNCVEMMVSII